MRVGLQMEYEFMNLKDLIVRMQKERELWTSYIAHGGDSRIAAAVCLDWDTECDDV
jgi:hypothetical protein